MKKYSSNKIKTIDDYINGQNKELQPILEKVREVIKGVAKEANERISWQMPTFWQKENVIHFAACKNHLGIYPGDLTINPFQERLKGYIWTKGSIHFPYDAVDYDLIIDIVKWRIETITLKYHL